jgi:glycosyltransferase involved in cell wall biosynthesis
MQVLCSQSSTERDNLVVKIFVTGVYGSGKTFFARQYALEHALEYISFDHIHDYQSKDDQLNSTLYSLPSEFVVDAIPFDADYTWNGFAEYEEQNDGVQVVVVYCPNRKLWLERVKRKAQGFQQFQDILAEVRQFRSAFLPDRSFLGLVQRGIAKILRKLDIEIGSYWIVETTGNENRSVVQVSRISPRGHITILKIDSKMHLKNYREFFSGKLSWFEKFRKIRFFDSEQNEYTSLETMLDRINFRAFKLEEHLQNQDKHYDKGYQDIEVLNQVGYSQSYKTWERIQDLVDWQGKEVLDLGCHHGYFSFKIEDVGGRVRGLDISSTVVETCRLINEVKGGNVIFEVWADGDPLPEADIILCLNVLHHFKNPDMALSSMKCQTAIFEINQSDLPLVEKHFHIRQEVSSHRENRVILVAEPRS